MFGGYAPTVWCLLAFIGLIFAWPKYGNLIATAIIAVIWGFAMFAVNIVIAVLHALGCKENNVHP
jgi:hypothetical protein